MKKFLIILLLSISNCGYQPLYVDANNEELIFKEIDLRGDKKINRKIINTVSLVEDSNDLSKDELYLNSNLSIDETSKNSKGQVTSLRTMIVVNLTVKNDDKVLKNKIFTKNFSYNNRENKFELVEYQKEVENNIINEIIEEIIFYMNL